MTAAIVLLAFNDLRLRRIDADPQTLSDLLCHRIYFPDVVGPLGWHITAYRLDCTFFGMRSATNVHMLGAYRSGNASDLIFRYVGSPPHATWIDHDHLVVQVDKMTSIKLLLKVYAGVQITVEAPAPDGRKYVVE